MIRSFLLSLAAHILVAASGLFVWNTVPRGPAVEVIDISLEGIELSETTNLKEIRKPQPPVKEPPKTEPEELADEPEESPQEAKPEEAAPQPEEVQIPDETKKEEPPPKPEPTPEPKKTPTPEPTKTPLAQKRSEPKEKSLDDLFSDTEDLLKEIKKDTKSKGPATPPKELKDQETKSQKGAGDRQGNQATVRDFIIAQIKADECYRSIKDLPDWERLIVTVRFQLDSKGRISVAPKRIQPSSIPNYDTYMKQAESRAIRAINLCAPYRLPEEDYDLWRNENIDLTFDERF